MSQSLSPVTVWYRWDGIVGDWEYNHLGDGHELTDKPAPRHPIHIKGWSGGKWIKYHMWLTDDLPAKVVGYTPDDLAYGEGEQAWQ